MENNIPTIRKAMDAKGYSRREFLLFCGLATAAAGLELSGFTQVVDAFETKLVRLSFGCIFKNALVVRNHLSARRIRLSLM